MLGEDTDPEHEVLERGRVDRGRPAEPEEEWRAAEPAYELVGIEIRHRDDPQRGVAHQLGLDATHAEEHE